MRLTIKDRLAVCCDMYCSIKGAPIGRLVDENMRKERAVPYSVRDNEDQKSVNGVPNLRYRMMA